MLSLGIILVATGTRVLCDVTRAEGMLTYCSGCRRFSGERYHWVKAVEDVKVKDIDRGQMSSRSR
jgi:predicted Fe-S protein YdhL (DUF1289 family)